jgi:hypothetical protein
MNWLVFTPAYSQMQKAEAMAAFYAEIQVRV